MQPQGLADAGTSQTSTLLSIVVPMRNEADNVAPLMARLVPVLNNITSHWEILCVDDGSTDETWERIRQAGEQDSRIIGLKLSRGFGHQYALLAGLSGAQGAAVVTMDGDLQHPPELIAQFVALWRAGFAIVTTQRQEARSTGTFKRFTSRCFLRLFSFLATVHIPEGSSEFRLLDCRVVQVLLRFQDPDMFLRGAVEWVGFRSTRLSFTVEPRVHGQTKFTLHRMLRLAVEATLAFSVMPLYVATLVGLVTTLIACGELLYVVMTFMRGHTVPGWASTVGITSLLFGILFLLLGLLNIYIARIYRVLQRRPRFIIAEDTRRTRPVSVCPACGQEILS